MKSCLRAKITWNEIRMRLILGIDFGYPCSIEKVFHWHFYLKKQEPFKVKEYMKDSPGAVLKGIVMIGDLVTLKFMELKFM